MVTAIFSRLVILLDNVRFEHTIFALPFAYLGMILAEQRLPELWQVVWITVAMTGARTLAMSANRLIDREIDARNPRTMNRPLPRGAIAPWQVLAIAVASAAVLLVAAWQLNDLCLKLAPLAIAVVAAYPYAKRFTWLSHWWLGVADGLAPVGGWFAVRPEVTFEVLLLGLAVATWVAGFDLIYACQDVEVDRKQGLHSVAARFGIAASLHLSAAMHVATAAALLGVGALLGLGVLYYVGWLCAVGLLVYEHALVSPGDLSRLNTAFFNVNGYIAVIVFAFTFASLVL